MDEDAYIDAASAMLDLEIAEAYRPGVRRFMTLAGEMADLLKQVPLDDAEFALAPVYLPPGAEEIGHG